MNIGGIEVDIKPWLVVVVKPEQQVFFFDDHVQAIAFCEEHPMLTCVIAYASAVLGPKNGVGVIQPNDALERRAAKI